MGISWKLSLIVGFFLLLTTLILVIASGWTVRRNLQAQYENLMDARRTAIERQLFQDAVALMGHSRTIAGDPAVISALAAKDQELLTQQLEPLYKELATLHNQAPYLIRWRLRAPRHAWRTQKRGIS